MAVNSPWFFIYTFQNTGITPPFSGLAVWPMPLSVFWNLLVLPVRPDWLHRQDNAGLNGRQQKIERNNTANALLLCSRIYRTTA